MIHVDRSAVAAPQMLIERWPEERERAARLADEGRNPSRFDFSMYNRPKVRDALSQLFHSKCAYCETRVGVTSKPDVEHYRPKGNITNEFGDTDQGYWWLAGEWDNLLLACQTCNRRFRESGKGNFFPIAGERAATYTTGAELAAEQPLLLDPTIDQPDDHLVFLEDGSVVSDTERGRTTIRIIGLNRDALQNARREAIEQARRDLASGRGVADAMAPDAEYSAAVRHVLGPLLDTSLLPDSVGALPDESMKTQIAESYTSHVVEQQDFTARAAVEQKMAMESTPSTGAAPVETDDLQRFVGNDWLVERVELTNVKSIPAITLELTAPVPDDAAAGDPTPMAPWTVLIGENATGKSTVLDATVMALIGQEYAEDLVASGHVNPADFVRRGEDEGIVTVKLGESLRSVKFTKDSDRLEFDNSVEAQNFVLAYGATRLLARDRGLRYGKSWARVDNLFSSFQPLAPPELLLRELRDHKPDAFEHTRELWSETICPVPGSELDFEGDELVVHEHGLTVPVRLLSDGYQTALALVTDTLQVVFNVFDSPESARGLVVIDEVGSHLHPTWKMRVVEQLRTLMPRMQFLATTHDPLCLRGLKTGEIALMQRHEDGYSFGRFDMPSPERMRVDQLLTSRFFGLATTIDPALDAEFSEYYQLLAMTSAQVEELGQTDRLAELRERLSGEGMLGHTRRDQLIYEAIDQFLAAERAAERRPGETATDDPDRQAVYAHIGKLWNYEAVREGLTDA